MKDIAIKVEGLGKQYRLGRKQESYKTLRDVVSRSFATPFRRFRSPSSSASANRANSIWALKNLSFELERGEVIGIIGRNGAGKSTLLKILSRITDPTEGYADVHGTVSSLLEVGIGFHGELSGRENIYLNAAILGMKRYEIDRNFDEIVAFAEIEKFIDTPVKWYSSGMYLRLAFAVAAHLESQILIVDEVLAVGDAQFQSKCLGKMDQISRGGRTILFVSHNLSAIQSLCNRVLWVQHGRVVDDGNPGLIVSKYLKTATTSVAERIWNDPITAPGDEAVRLHSIRIIPQDSTVDVMNTRTPLVIEVQHSNFRPTTELDLTITIHNQEGICLFSSNSSGDHAWHGKPLREGSFKTTCHIPGDMLNGGVYRVSLLVTKESSIVVHRETDALVFELKDDVMNQNGWYGKWPGVIRPKLLWVTEPLDSSSARAVRYASRS